MKGGGGAKIADKSGACALCSTDRPVGMASGTLAWGGLSTPFRDARHAIPRWVRWSQRTKVWVVEDLQRASPTKLPPPHSEAAAPSKRLLSNFIARSLRWTAS